MAEHFVARFGRRADVLLPLFEREQPQVVVCDEVDVGAVIAAERLGIPCVTVSVIAAGRLFAPPVVGVAWNERRSSYGLSADPDGRLLGGTMALTPVPRSFRDPAQVVLASRRFVRPAIIDDVTVVKPPARLVYATLGTVFNLESGDLLERLIDAASLMDAEVVVTTGPQISRNELPATPDSVLVEQFVPQRDVLPDVVQSYATAAPAPSSPRSRWVFLPSSCRWAPTSSTTPTAAQSSASVSSSTHPPQMPNRSPPPHRPC